jgi:hypothetical protein
MKVIGFWSSTSEEERGDTLVYMLGHACEEAASASWEAYGVKVQNGLELQKRLMLKGESFLE